jgi:hypothetical protein
MNPKEAIDTLRATIESQGPDTANRHYGRNQFATLLECCDTLEALLGDDPVAVLGTVAATPLEDMEDTDEVMAAWLTADDIASRLRAVLVEANVWWSP